MKKVLFFLLSLTVCLALVGCSTAPTQEPTATDAVESEIEPRVLIHTSDGDVEPYMQFRSAQTWEKHGWFAACGASVYSTLPTICDELPTVTYNKDFGISYGENVSFYRLEIFSKGLQRTEYTELATLPQGTYYISIEITRQGDYIAAGEDYERFGSAAVFRMIMP